MGAKHWLLVVAVSIFIIQLIVAWRSRRTLAGDVTKLLLMSVRNAVNEHTNPRVDLKDVRAMIHMRERVKVGPQKNKEWCLVPVQHSTSTPPPDYGPIPLDRESYKMWYVNVRAFHSRITVVDEPNLNTRPADDGFYLQIASKFNATLVIAVPLIDPNEPSSALGTLSIDARATRSQLTSDPTKPGDPLNEKLVLAAAMIAFAMVEGD